MFSWYIKGLSIKTPLQYPVFLGPIQMLWCNITQMMRHQTPVQHTESRKIKSKPKITSPFKTHTNNNENNTKSVGFLDIKVFFCTFLHTHTYRCWFCTCQPGSSSPLPCPFLGLASLIFIHEENYWCFFFFGFGFGFSNFTDPTDSRKVW